MDNIWDKKRLRLKKDNTWALPLSDLLTPRIILICNEKPTKSIDLLIHASTCWVCCLCFSAELPESSVSFTCGKPTSWVWSLLSPLHLQAIINCTVTPSMAFTKTSQKFGQWADSRANTVYGLGFATEQQLHQVNYTPEVKNTLKRLISRILCVSCG